VVRYLVSPVVHGPTWFRSLTIAGVWDFLGGYVGVSAAASLHLPWVELEPGASPVWRSAGILAVGLGVLLKNFGIPPFTWVGHLPLFDNAWSPRWAGPAWTFSITMAAGLALDTLIRRRDAPNFSRLLPLLGAAAVGAFVFTNAPELLTDPTSALSPPKLAGRVAGHCVASLAGICRGDRARRNDLVDLPTQ